MQSLQIMTIFFPVMLFCKMLTVMVKHVMSSTKLMQSQQTPYSSPSVCNDYLSANGMESQLES